MFRVLYHRGSCNLASAVVSVPVSAVSSSLQDRLSVEASLVAAKIGASIILKWNCSLPYDRVILAGLFGV